MSSGISPLCSDSNLSSLLSPPSGSVNNYQTVRPHIPEDSNVLSTVSVEMHRLMGQQSTVFMELQPLTVQLSTFAV
jgi:hypothetical protein